MVGSPRGDRYVCRRWTSSLLVSEITQTSSTPLALARVRVSRDSALPFLTLFPQTCRDEAQGLTEMKIAQ
jgi:hypothetical protein